MLEDIKDHKGALEHLYRTLRPGGMLLLTTTCYATSIFTMFYVAKNARLSPVEIARESCRWVAGYFGSNAYRDAFIEQWCFKPLGGHYHGFLHGELLDGFRQAGFNVVKAGVFYAIEPLQIHFLHSHTLGGLMRRKDWSPVKRAVGAVVYVVGHPLNRALKALDLFANNAFVIAQKH